MDVEYTRKNSDFSKLNSIIQETFDPNQGIEINNETKIYKILCKENILNYFEKNPEEFEDYIKIGLILDKLNERDAILRLWTNEVHKKLSTAIHKDFIAFLNKLNENYDNIEELQNVEMDEFLIKKSENSKRFRKALYYQYFLKNKFDKLTENVKNAYDLISGEKYAHIFNEKQQELQKILENNKDNTLLYGNPFEDSNTYLIIKYHKMEPNNIELNPKKVKKDGYKIISMLKDYGDNNLLKYVSVNLLKDPKIVDYIHLPKTIEELIAYSTLISALDTSLKENIYLLWY